MADNLTIQIGADTSKLRSQIELAQVQIQNLRRLARGALRKDDAAGAAEYTQQIGRLQTNLVGLNRTLAETGAVVESTSRSFAISARSLRSFEAAVFNVGKQFGGLGIAGFAAFRGLQALGQQISEVHQNLLKLRDTAAELGTRPGVIEAAQRIVGGVGGQAEDAIKILGGAAEALAKFRTAAGAPIDTTGVEVFRGGVKQAGEAARQAALEIGSGVNVMRGAQQQVFDLSQAYAMVGVNLAKYKDTTMAAEKVTIDAIRGFLKLAESGRLGASQLNALSKELFKGIPAGTMLREAPALLKQLTDEINKQQPIVTPRIAAAEELETQKNRVKQVFTDIKLAINDVWTSWDIATTTALANFLTRTLPQFGTDVTTFFTNLWPNTVTAFAEAWADTAKLIAPLTQAFQDLFNSIGPMAQAAFDSVLNAVSATVQRIADAVRSAVASVGSALGGGGAGPVPGGELLPQYAGGGSVRGPGSATSDSILARLSAGEYVMRARAVDHWGPRFMASLNALRSPFGFAGGGLVMPQRSLPRFAEGGLVAAGGGGSPVHLHLGGHSFALSGSTGVVDALVVEARRQQVRSAGVKPSWYGGRPGGH